MQTVTMSLLHSSNSQPPSLSTTETEKKLNTDESNGLAKKDSLLVQTQKSSTTTLADENTPPWIEAHEQPHSSKSNSLPKKLMNRSTSSKSINKSISVDSLYRRDWEEKMHLTQKRSMQDALILYLSTALLENLSSGLDLGEIASQLAVALAPEWSKLTWPLSDKERLSVFFGQLSGLMTSHYGPETRAKLTAFCGILRAQIDPYLTGLLVGKGYHDSDETKIYWELPVDPSETLGKHIINNLTSRLLYYD